MKARIGRAPLLETHEIDRLSDLQTIAEEIIHPLAEQGWCKRPSQERLLLMCQTAFVKGKASWQGVSITIL